MALLKWTPYNANDSLNVAIEIISSTIIPFVTQITYMLIIVLVILPMVVIYIYNDVGCILFHVYVMEAN